MENGEMGVGRMEIATRKGKIRATNEKEEIEERKGKVGERRGEQGDKESEKSGGKECK